ncbi:hypothetical protein TCON_0340 [Astathelohania contejeani]|uniref:Uncharacterized protein n=1 Tax=Astathelohania contejeani TaxID=164912 RepID=A0ABQ7I1Z3_9MICR|nr:hypothetical protein TCON_0340 [Thelohania contejeani]
MKSNVILWFFFFIKVVFSNNTEKPIVRGILILESYGWSKNIDGLKSLINKELVRSRMKTGMKRRIILLKEIKNNIDRSPHNTNSYFLVKFNNPNKEFRIEDDAIFQIMKKKDSNIDGRVLSLGLVFGRKVFYLNSLGIKPGIEYYFQVDAIQSKGREKQKVTLVTDSIMSNGIDQIYFSPDL